MLSREPRCGLPQTHLNHGTPLLRWSEALSSFYGSTDDGELVYIVMDNKGLHDLADKGELHAGRFKLNSEFVVPGFHFAPNTHMLAYCGENGEVCVCAYVCACVLVALVSRARVYVGYGTARGCVCTTMAMATTREQTSDGLARETRVERTARIGVASQAAVYWFNPKHVGFAGKSPAHLTVSSWTFDEVR